MSKKGSTREALHLIEVGHGWGAAWNIAQFRKSSHNAIAVALIDADLSEAVADCLSDFSGLCQEVALQLIAREGANCVIENLGSFNDLNTGEVVIAIAGSDDAEYLSDYLPLLLAAAVQ